MSRIKKLFEVRKMVNLIILSVAPVVTILFYVYIRDRYEKEPLYFLITGILYGIITAAPIYFCETYIEESFPEIKNNVLFVSFVSASFTEEIFKLIVIILLCYRSKHYNTFFDGIVYSVFISLGFAGAENILYVLDEELGGVQTAILRAFLSVPAHALFAVTMGYFISAAKYKRKFYIIPAFLSPFLKHGMYDFILMSEFDKYYIIFGCFMIYIWADALKKFNSASLF